MTLAVQSEVRDVHGIDREQKSAIKAFLQGAVYCWIKNRKGEEFAARDLVGGENAEWSGTPLQPLYAKHIDLGKDEDAAIDAAGRDVGWLLKAVLAEDRRTFKAIKEHVNHYRWVDTA